MATIGLHMFPHPTACNKGGVGWGNAKLWPNFHKRYTRVMQKAYLLYVRFCELCAIVVCSAPNFFRMHPTPMLVPCACASFSLHLDHIIRMGAKTKMRRVDALRIVAIVQNKHLRRERTIYHFVHKSMSTPISSVQTNLSVAQFADCDPSPRPAFFWFPLIDSFPDAISPCYSLEFKPARSRAKVTVSPLLLALSSKDRLSTLLAQYGRLDIGHALKFPFRVLARAAKRINAYGSLYYSIGF